MTSLEFIEKEIENIKYLLELDDVLCLKTDTDYKFWINKLQTLQQIKVELEAWEITKTDLILSILLKDLANGESVNYHKLSKENQETLKKALEVEDESRNS